MRNSRHLLSSRVITIEVPDGHHELRTKLTQLLTDRAALIRRLTRPVSPTQRKNIQAELGAINAEIKLIKSRLECFAQQSSKKDRRKRRQRDKAEIASRGITPYPEGRSFEHKFRWALYILQIALDLLHDAPSLPAPREKLIQWIGSELKAAKKDLRQKEAQNKKDQQLAQQFIRLKKRQ